MTDSYLLTHPIILSLYSSKLKSYLNLNMNINKPCSTIPEVCREPDFKILAEALEALSGTGFVDMFYLKKLFNSLNGCVHDNKAN